MRLLLYGGTFDPPHNGHVHNVQAAAQRVKPDKVLVMPAGVPPHKAASRTPASLRLEMCRAAFLPMARQAGLALEVSGWEIGQAEKGIANYTATTLEMLCGQYPGAQLYLALGSDMLLGFERWHAWRQILQLAALAVVSREKDDRAALQAMAARLEAAGGRVLFVETPALPMASSALRARLAAGDPCAAALPEGVRAVIEREGLYRPGCFEP